jgi:hypothetical protein
MGITVAQMYALRTYAKLTLPQVVQDNIAKLRNTPMAFKPFQKPVARRPPHSVDNWREKALMDIVRRVKEREDPEYADIFAIFNKISASNLEKLSKDAIEKIQKRDDTFRLRIATLLFDKAITQHAYASVMAECARVISAAIPDMVEDMVAQADMFPKLYNLNETLTFPSSSEADFDNKVIEWMKQKEKRRGYAKFMMELSRRGLVTTERVQTGLQDVVNELGEIARQPRSAQTEENVGQFAVFLFETAKLAKDNAVLKTFMKESIGAILKTEKSSLPSLNMKSRFKLEDAFKLTQ